MGDCLVAVTFLEVETGAGQGILNVVDDAECCYCYDLCMEAVSLGR